MQALGIDYEKTFSLVVNTVRTELRVCSKPISNTTKLSLNDEEPFREPTLYRSIIGAFQYLILTRPNVAFAIKKLIQFLKSPIMLHWEACKKLLRYLKGAISGGLFLKPSVVMTIESYSDDDWASCFDDRRLTGGYVVYLGDNLIS
ncbi:uncharacterized mitochondrial protein AtMg00810-like [Cannabis sativa]|uniref:uncharacterized mitochondrial protein AtMg00810-like n=1 Tax=Cannabis sativa TaxID=3483 RepID=UPI0029CA034F|nr:uncharacterized mitochondrial protein AtMg00810-like [Cannabis sativa]